MGVRATQQKIVCAFVLLLAPTGVLAGPAASVSAVSGNTSAQHPMGRFEVFVANPDSHHGGVFHTWQLVGSSGWQPVWQQYLPVPDNNPHGLVSGIDSLGRIVVAWISKGEIHFAEALNAGASLLNSNALTVRPMVDPNEHKTYKFKYLQLARNTDGTIEIFALTEAGRVFSIHESSPTNNGQPWIGKLSGPRLLGGGGLAHLSVTTLKGALALVGTGDNGQVYVKNQSTPGVWDPDPWTNLGGNQIKEARAQESKDHQLEIVALGHDKRLYLAYQNLGSTAFVPWQLLLSPNVDQNLGPAFFLDRFADGTLIVVSHRSIQDIGIVSSGSFTKAFQNPNNGAWPNVLSSYHAITSHSSGFTNPDYLAFLDPLAFTLIRDATGRIHFFACYSGGKYVEHYIEHPAPASDGSLSYENGQEHAIPPLP